MTDELNPFLDDPRNTSLRSFILRQFISGVMTDEERARLWGLPKGCRMRENAKIISPDKLTCGEYVWIGEGAILDASGGLEIGAHTSVGLNVYLWSHTSFLTNLTMNNIMGNPLIERKKTTIGKGCFIGGPSVIYPGVTIGDRTVILPMTVVTKDLPGNMVVAGSPAKKMSDINDEWIQQRIDGLKIARG
ncbi:MAG: acetyltransferase [Deltaproteobacteria bacterium RIFOXYA12_FULL_61_11]|nr:MAG: acetyltransferase [Deltaproteobacteria bacterium RIFOXYA12_FULL_61_11]